MCVWGNVPGSKAGNMVPQVVHGSMKLQAPEGLGHAGPECTNHPGGKFGGGGKVQEKQRQETGVGV